jgi:uncharacterized DUF497 family protein
MKSASFEWDEEKDHLNRKKHGVSFYDAQEAFLDPNRVIAEDVDHSNTEKRYYCFGKTSASIMTVRFTYRNNKIRIFGAAYWRQGKKIYEQAQN